MPITIKKGTSRQGTPFLNTYKTAEKNTDARRLGSIIFIKLPSFDGIVPDFHLLSPSKKTEIILTLTFLTVPY
ncbi:hypothetical protein BJP43_06015 [Candidatus Williamhamiltonella defendens]|uniref:Uncharacterized protein n=1 Tax=Candidatus Williamhamiltonella defendens TaxID=138072 RepID=A0A2D3TDL3_9ENTR|nr:hypothetical protein BJP43_06015 [Candidatus Hamiltonella defensa]